MHLTSRCRHSQILAYCHCLFASDIMKQLYNGQFFNAMWYDLVFSQYISIMTVWRKSLVEAWVVVAL